MIQTCGESLTLPLNMIFQAALNDDSFPDNQKKSNFVPDYNNEFKNILKNYRPLSLTPIFAKIFEKI